MSTPATPFQMGQYLERQPGGNPLSYDDELVPRGVPLLVTFTGDECTEVKPPEGRSVTVWTRELAEPAFRVLPETVRTNRTNEEFMDFFLELMREERDAPPIGNLIDPQPGDRFRRTGRPRGAIQPYFIYPEDGVIEVEVATTSMVYVKKVGQEGARHYCVPRTSFTDAFVELVPCETNPEEAS